MRPDLLTYLDFRLFLKDLTRHLKEEEGFELRGFARKADLKAPGYLKMIIDGRRNVTPDTANKFCLALGISGKLKAYFEKLVAYNQTHDPDLKKEYFEDLHVLRPRSSAFMEERRLNRYFSKPYYVTIREMVMLKDFREDPKWIAKRIFPSIRPSEVKEAIDTLLDLGLLKRDSNGKLYQADELIRTEDKDTQAVEAYHFHEAMIDRARHALARLEQNERHYHALTLPLPKELADEIIRDFRDFRDKILSKVEHHTQGADEVFQVNFQLFPATRKDEKS